MADVIQQWWRRTLSDPQVVSLIVLLVTGILLATYAGNLVAPIVAALVIAYMLDGGVSFLERRGLPRGVALLLIYILFLIVVAGFIFFLVPALSQQIGLFIDDLPNLLRQGRALLLQLPDKYPGYIGEDSIGNFVESLRDQMIGVANNLLHITLSSVAGFISFLIYMVLVPLLIFFFLKDKRAIFAWLNRFMPQSGDQNLTHTVWGELNKGASGYIRGKMIEIVIMWVAHWIAFVALDLRYASLLSFLAGLSVVVPFLGAAVVTIPIALVGYAQWGFTDPFIYLMVTYAILQVLDGNVLVPVLFAETVKIHPIAIILAVLVFGHIWGIWGVFFAIPLATLVNAVLNAWPRKDATIQSAPQ